MRRYRVPKATFPCPRIEERRLRGRTDQKEDKDEHQTCIFSPDLHTMPLTCVLITYITPVFVLQKKKTYITHSRLTERKANKLRGSGA